MTDLTDLVLRWIHILSAAALAGGLFFLWWVWLPATANLSGNQHRAAHETQRHRWAGVVMGTSALLLVSGLINAVRIIRAGDLPGMYHGLVAVKLLLALAVFWISATLSGRSALAQRLQQKSPTWLGLNLILVVGVVCLGGYMRQVRSEPQPAGMSLKTDGDWLKRDPSRPPLPFRGSSDGQESKEEAR